MKQLFLLIALIPISLFAQLQMKRVTFLNSGLYSDIDGRVVCGDFNHDGKNEMIFRTKNTTYPFHYRWEIWLHCPMNCYEIVYACTTSGVYPPPNIETGWLYPDDADYMDQDNAIDLVGQNRDYTTAISTVMEGPDSSSYPINLVWYSSLGIWYSQMPHYIADLDRDGRKEILVSWFETRIYENTGNNQYQLVFDQTPASWAFYAISDFDQDGRMDFAFPGGDSVLVRECVSDNQYSIVWSSPFPSGLTNPYDCWSGQDVDNDGRPEFFIAFWTAIPGIYYLYMWEAVANNTYEATFIDQINGGDASRMSACGDIDGDGIEEIIWSVGRRILIYKATGNNQFQRVLIIPNYHGGQTPAAIITIFDMNKNGYNEIIHGGNGYTSIFEVEVIQLLYPNGGQNFFGNTQELIRWQTFYPPRCDSLSLFYTTDNGRTYQSIVHGLQSTDTSYVWTVPNVNSDSCKVKIIAYGPGWQYDESDWIFRITSTGINEIATLSLAMTFGLKVYPNPAKSVVRVRYSLPTSCSMLNAQRITLNLYDISGRLVKTLVDEYQKPGNYSITINSKTICSGVYFLVLQTESKRIIERVVILK